MRHDCRHFESRTYANGETVRKCNLDLAPEAPWRCPEPCAKFDRRIDVGWTYGSMVAPSAPVEPPGLGDGSAAAVLDEAEEVVNSIGARVLAEFAAEQEARTGRWRRLFRRR